MSRLAMLFRKARMQALNVGLISVASTICIYFCYKFAMMEHSPLKTLWNRKIAGLKYCTNCGMVDTGNVNGKADDMVYFGKNPKLSRKLNTRKYVSFSKKDCNTRASLFQGTTQGGRIKPYKLKRFPRAICIGLPKAGTRAMLEYLKFHPKVAVNKKETAVFLYPPDKNGKWREYYLYIMPCSYADQITFEKNPNYASQRGKLIAERIYQFDPAMKLIFAVRNPIDRAMSHYIDYYVRTGRTHGKTFEQMVVDNGTAEINQSFVPVKRSLFDDMIEPWLTVFNRSQILIVDGDTLVKHPLAEVQKLEQFLNIYPYFNETMFHYNETKGFYCFVDQGQDQCLSSDKGTVHPSIELTVVMKLKKLFRPHNQRFFQMVGQEFDWE